MKAAKLRPGRTGRIAEIYRSLEEADRRTLLAFAEFLAARPAPPERPGERLEPEPIERPVRESVVAAIKRLAHSYYMLDRGAMLNETSSLMSAHVLGGRPANEVIDELESLFQRHYVQYCEEREA